MCNAQRFKGRQVGFVLLTSIAGARSFGSLPLRYNEKAIIMFKAGCFLSCIAVTRSFSSIPSCSSDKAELAGKRLQTLGALNSVFTSFGASDAFSLDSFISELGPLVTPEFSLIVPYGGGTYDGLNDAAEYLSLQFSSVNVGLSSFNLSDTAGVLPAMSIDGDEYTLKTNFAASFFLTMTPFLRLPVQSEVVVTFAPCRPRTAHPLCYRAYTRSHD